MTVPVFQRARFGTRDVEQGEDYIRQMYVDSRLRVDGSTGEFEFASELLMFDGVFIGGTRATIAATIAAPDGIERVTIFGSRRPIRVGPTGQQQSLAAGDAICIPLRVPYAADWATLQTDLVSFAPGQLEAAAVGSLDPKQMLRFAFDRASSPVAAETWRRTAGFVRYVAAANVGIADGALLASELAQLLSATALTCFGNTTMTDSDPRPTRSTPGSLRRAVAFIDSNLDQPITMEAITEAAQVTARALNMTFNRYHGISTMGYVRQARLDQAHRDLQAAQPGDGETVTGIAARWGFYSLPRFGVYYRRAYGVPPSHTLRSG